MNRTRRLAVLALLVTPALAVGPTMAAHASTATATATSTATAPDAANRAACHVETESNGKYHLWGEGLPGGKEVTYSGSTSGTVRTDKSGGFDLGGLSGGKFTVKTSDGKKLTCAMVRY
ncbi:hypothetical protein ACFV0T_13890 [Streptomyces sp. NPDC059582]|uniref:hypothetical protein n=1 Tax=Streptomyces sp. NPDC059582 TaxID=3346875 RepID=UPI0036B539F3